ncbi:serine/threonine-protein phosphatase 1 regulatory subunit 10-like [Vespa mandarinia]|uniref:serine/threonine-protein phosphatase 1 regulatory subunit 10-like n=1 Tax=Vespa mandarinia TaxID=7446 RepID=UPI00160D274E|nr:serine/threonine-protein phosphatase 1 regulatory subunit 10-like [Vespa mandarinia]XP_035740879.1 serine/threonine-protein phosphatase 1 regulatory subunit 10-like [Vespa mandarinia]XP_035740880.1 serine/threonine-protein phosphatase 1 regulatory subunit 10-like [Vespa mandarinia]XP_035740881.1 serine/threonine-protein phosphatase 1 regulatory subunit 10-like [Vespa mandarinia]XP_046835636.1 serine/threonine-protein phosphatase 1 regulatory subunit 10 [Vespa crabro]XP_046835637.1 serine/th
MPRIDPLSLLKCLSVLLGPTGGIKSKEEVNRLANLMTKFSKKLVSKCIYIQILKTTNTDLLSQFMAAGGWNLIHMWLTDGILAKNWALIQELLELLLLCPVDVDRLKSNNCPKLIKGLSKEGSHQGVRILASRLVEQWLKIVKGEVAPNSVPAHIMTIPMQSNSATAQGLIIQSTQQQSQQQQYSINSGIQKGADDVESVTVHVQDLQFTQSPQSIITATQVQQQVEEQHLQEKHPMQLQVVSKPQQTQLQQQASQLSTKKQSFVVVSSQSSVPLYKITIRDGKQVLTKVETDATNITSNNTTLEVNGEVKDTVFSLKEDEEKTKTLEGSEGVHSEQDDMTEVQPEQSDQISSEVKQSTISSKDSTETGISNVKIIDNKDGKDIVSSDSNKSSDKENRDSHKKDDKKSSSGSDKKSGNHHHSSSSSSKSSSKHGASSSSHRSSSTSHRSSSHRSSSSSTSKSSTSKDKSSRDRDKHHSNSSSKHNSNNKNKSDKEKEREKEKQKKDQAEKDKATLEKVQGQILSSKLGKIPKKKSEDSKTGDGNKKVMSDSRDSSKENKDKIEGKKSVIVSEKKNISISIESRKNTQDSTARPKTVKTFNSKFRSTGLEEEVKPPPPRSAKKSSPVVDKKMMPLPKLPVLKRPSPLREVLAPSDKRAKLSLDSPTTPPSDEKKGGIKLIPPKPKPMMLQESDMFMDALTASTKSKEPRKRKRRTSITKDGSSDVKKQEIINADSREITPPPTSPSSTDEKSPVVVKPNFKFYQDTLETEEDKEQKDKESNGDEIKRDKEDIIDNQKDSRDNNDDDGSSTPTPEDDTEETKTSDSPEEASSDGLDSLKKENSPYPEIRYVDGLRSVLLLQKRKGPKKTLKWKTDLESIRYFELDETERVNVTKTFTDMKQMEKQNEREAFQMARKLSNEDLMEERTRWKPLIPIDLPPALVEPGKDSREKDIQYAREKGILQALYFNRSMIPDSPAEPDEERHHIITDPKIIPLDDLTGNKESEKDFTNITWPEPKPQLPVQPSTITNFHYPPYSHNQQPMMAPVGPQGPINPIPQMPQQMIPPTHMGQMTPEMAGPIPAGGGGWRTGDGKVVVPDVGINPMANIPGTFPQGMEGGPMVPPGMMGPPPMYNQQDGYGMMGPEDMGFNNMNPNNFQGPPGPMYGPGPNFQGPRGPGGPMHVRGRGGPGPGWYRGCGPGRGGWRGGGGGWRGSGKQPRVCMQFTKNGYCRVGEKCQYLHPGVNCPPF